MPISIFLISYDHPPGILQPWEFSRTEPSELRRRTSSTSGFLDGSEAIEMLGHFLQQFGRVSCSNGGVAYHMLS